MNIRYPIYEGVYRILTNRMSALLFELEMKGVIRALAGGVYRLIM